MTYDHRGKARLEAPLAPHLRQAILDRLRQLNDGLDRRDPRKIAGIVAQMLAAWPRRTGEGDAAVTLAAYASALADLPPWAVAEAAQRLVAGQEPRVNPAFPPAAAELRRVAEAIVQPWRDERASLSELAHAPDAKPAPSVGERERIGAAFDSLTKELGTAVDMGRELARGRAKEAADRQRQRDEERRVRACEAAGVDPSLGISPSLAAKLDEWASDASA